MLRLSLDAFEGPLDLLLHLIRKHTLDIFDIPIAFVTDEYLRYLDDAAERDLGVAGEYLVMAATLLQIKSTTLLPKKEGDEDDAEEEDPREALIRRLLAYQSFKEAAGHLSQRIRLFRDVFPRPEAPERTQPARTLDDIEPPHLFDLLEARQALLKRRQTPPVHEVTRHELSIKDAILRIATYLDRNPRTTFDVLVEQIPHHDPAHTSVITFMGLLEMAKLRMLTLFQTRLRGDELIVERSVIDIEEIALELDFSDANPVSDTAPLPEADEMNPDQGTLFGNEGAATPEDNEMPFDDLPDPALVEHKRDELRGRPRFVPRYAVLETDGEDEHAALGQLHAELDHYDLDAVLAQALELSKIPSRDLAPSNHDEHHG